MKTSPPSDPDAECRRYLEQLRSTNTREQEAGYYFWLPRLFKLVRVINWSFDPETQKDIVQDVLVSLYKNGHQQRPDGNAQAWVRMVVANACHDVWRRRKTRHADDHVDMDEVADEMVALSPDQNGDDCTEKVLAYYMENHADGPDDRVILNGLVQGLSHEEIALQTGRTKSAISTRACVLKKKLRELREELC